MMQCKEWVWVIYTHFQVLLKADQYKFYLNDNKIQFITDTDKNYDDIDRAGIDQAEYEKRLPESNHQTRLIL